MVFFSAFFLLLINEVILRRAFEPQHKTSAGLGAAMNAITSVRGGGMLKSAMAELHRAHMWAMVEIQVLMQCSAESFLELPT